MNLISDSNGGTFPGNFSISEYIVVARLSYFQLYLIFPAFAVHISLFNCRGFEIGKPTNLKHGLSHSVCFAVRTSIFHPSSFVEFGKQMKTENH